MKIYMIIVLLLSAACVDRSSPPQAGNDILPGNDTSPKWVDYRIGELPPEGYYNAFDSIIRKWNIRYQRIEGGCDVNTKDKHRYEKDNSKYFQILEQQFGKDWRVLFNKEVAALDSLR